MAEYVFSRWLDVNGKLVELEGRLATLRNDNFKQRRPTPEERDLATEVERIRKLADEELARAMEAFRKERTLRAPGRKVPRL